MPSHSHSYKKFIFTSYYGFRGTNESCNWYPCNPSENFLEDVSTNSKSGGKAHNNMPPYIIANCWRRTG